MVPNVNAEGAVKASSVTVEDCMAQCSADQLCIGFDYNRAAKPWLGVRCWLHHDNREMEVKPVVGTTHYQFVNCDGELLLMTVNWVYLTVNSINQLYFDSRTSTHSA